MPIISLRFLSATLLFSLLVFCVYLLDTTDLETKSHEAHVFDDLTIDVLSLAHLRENATLVMVCNENELGLVLPTMQQIEDQFNKHYHYPWVLLNDVEFSEKFRHQTRSLTHSHVHFGTIPSEHWSQPEWINPARANSSRAYGKAMHIPLGGSERRQHLNRFFAGLFVHHPLLQHYKYAWRVEPGSKYTCSSMEDPFATLRREDKIHGFALATKEFKETAYTLWEYVYDFLVDNPSLKKNDSLMSFITDDGGDSFNFCRYQSAFSITDMDFWRGDIYTLFFTTLDHKGGFYYERWSDAAVQTIALSLFVEPDKVHHFDNFGFATFAEYSYVYGQKGVQYCPETTGIWHANKCWCLPDDENFRDEESCIPKWKSLLAVEQLPTGRI